MFASKFFYFKPQGFFSFLALGGADSTAFFFSLNSVVRSRAPAREVSPATRRPPMSQPPRPLWQDILNGHHYPFLALNIFKTVPEKALLNIKNNIGKLLKIPKSYLLNSLYI
ncbi:MAG: hypothetical protein ACRC0H_18970 [Aeromonas sobria]